MVNKCYAVGCKSGYLSNSEKEKELVEMGTPITMHQFPKDAQLRQQWLYRCSRDTKHSTAEEEREGNIKKRFLCSLHFKDTDFNPQEKTLQGRERQVRRLKKDAVPSQFPNYPTLKKEQPVRPQRKTSTATACQRLDRENSETARRNLSFLEEDKFRDLPDLLRKLEEQCKRLGFM